MWNKFVSKLKKIFRKGGDDRQHERDEPALARVDHSLRDGERTKPRPQRFRPKPPQLVPAPSRKTVTRTSAKAERTIKTLSPVEAAPANVNPYPNPYKSQKSIKTAKTMKSTTIDDALPRAVNRSQKKSDREGRKEGNSMKSIGTFFDKVSRRAKKTFRFKSKPISQSRLARWTQKVEERRRRRQETPVTRSVRAYEEVFPDAITASARRSSTTTTTAAQSHESFSISSGKRKGNMAADGRVLLDGRPFWLEQSDDDLPTDDDLPMNAEVVLEVWAGKIKLVPMPTIPIKLDPMAAQSQLSDKDSLFFNKQVLFGNTVRTMINATDNCNTTSSDDRSELSACNQISDIQASIVANRGKQLTFVEPKDIVRYTAKKLRRDMFHKSTISDRTMKARKKVTSK